MTLNLFLLRTRKSARGMAMVVVMLALIAISAAAFFLCSITDVENRTTDRIRYSAMADAMADAGAAWATRQIMNSYAFGTVPALPLAPLSIENGTVSFTDPNTGASTITYLAADKRQELYTPTNNPPWGPDNASASGLRRVVYPYTLQAIATYTDPKSGRAYYGIVNKVVEIRCEPMFQFLSFWGNSSPFEALPGANMTLTGAIHANRDMYIGPSGGSPPSTSTNSQTFNTNYLRTAGQFHYARLDGSEGSQNDYANGGTLQISTLSTAGSSPTYVTVPSYATLQSAGVPTPSVNYTGMDSSFPGYSAKNEPSFANFCNTNLGGTLQTAAVGNVQPLSLPSIGTISSFMPAPAGTQGSYALNSSTGQYAAASGSPATYVLGPFRQQAKLLIKYNVSTGTSVAYDNTNPNSPVLLSGSSGNDAALPSGTISDQNGKMYDARQGVTVNLTQIDMTKLFNDPRCQPGGYFTQLGGGLLIYAYREDTLATQTIPNAATGSNGIRLVNGNQLANAMTLVTEDPLYVQGDFNAYSTATWKPVALMADAVSLLSGNWNDSKTSTSGLPSAAATTYNFAMLSGIVPSVTGGAYSGGLENFPRFHENWSGVTVSYTGSFVNLFNSVFAKGAWFCGAPVYNPPTRSYNFDTRFLTIGNLPPCTPVVVGTAQVVYWQLSPDW